MKTFLLAACLAIAGPTISQAANCLSSADAGATTCMAGVLYRCVCSQIVNMSVCAWNNTATGCSSFRDDGGSSLRTRTSAHHPYQTARLGASLPRSANQ
jgi:hypothetical protein